MSAGNHAAIWEECMQLMSAHHAGTEEEIMQLMSESSCTAVKRKSCRRAVPRATRDGTVKLVGVRQRNRSVQKAIGICFFWL